MYGLLANKCIKCIEYTAGSNNQSGQIVFYGGELYDGEIDNGLPAGWGIFELPDGSYYEGNFDSTGMTDGRFAILGRDFFEGKFSKDKILRGSLYFSDGDSLEGEWGNERMRWNLKSGF